jgi:hypothetical protein
MAAHPILQWDGSLDGDRIPEVGMVVVIYFIQP